LYLKLNHAFLDDHGLPLVPPGPLLVLLDLVACHLHLLLKLPDLLRILIVISDLIECASLPVLDPLHDLDLPEQVPDDAISLLDLRLGVSEALHEVRFGQLATQRLDRLVLLGELVVEGVQLLVLGFLHDMREVADLGTRGRRRADHLAVRVVDGIEVLLLLME
jgi:hypothetical protein